jgi:Fic family protein
MKSPFANRFVIESAAIERQTIPPTKVAASAHMQAYLQMIALADAKAELSQQDLKNWQALIGREQHLWGDQALPLSALGQYRKWDIGLGMRDGSVKSIGVKWEKVPAAMDDLWESVNASYGAEIALGQAAIIHHRFERIHGFADGNGRTGRLLALYILRCAGVPPVLFENWDKVSEYYPCFGEEEPDHMIEYFKKHQVKSGSASDDPWL